MSDLTRLTAAELGAADRRRRGLRRRGRPRPTWTGSPRSTAGCTRSCTSTPRARSRRPRAVDAARAAGETLGPLAGVPIAVKDVIATKGVPDHRRLEDPRGLAPAVRRDDRRRGCATAGLVMLGKTNMDEFAMGSSTEYSRLRPDAQPVGPRPASRAAPAAARPRRVAAYEAPLAIGTDTGGSIRQPGAVTGTVGAKPTYGGTSRYGLIAFSSSLDTPGPCARTVLGRRAAARGDRRARPARLDLDPAAGARRGRGRPAGRDRRPDRRAARPGQGVRRRGRRARRAWPRSATRSRRWPSWAPRSSRCPARTSSTRCRPTT